MAAPAAEALEALPPPPLEPRASAASAALPQSGAQAISHSSLARINTGTGTLSLESAPAGAGALCWGMFCFGELTAEDLPVRVEATLTGALPAEYYLGIPDYRSGSWRWTRVGLPTGVDAALGADGPLSPQGNLYCVVAAFGGESLELSTIRVQADIALPPPPDFSATQDWPFNIDISWTDPAVAYDPEGPDAFHYDSIDLEFALDPRGPWTPLTSLAAGQNHILYSYLERPLPPLGQALYFRARTTALGQSGPPSNAARGLRQFLAPRDLRASDGTLLDRVELSWLPTRYASTYEIYARDNASSVHGFTLVSTVPASFPLYEGRFVCSGGRPPNGRPIVYQVRAVATGGLVSTSSNQDTGYRELPVPQDVQASLGLYEDHISVTWDALPAVSAYSVRLVGPKGSRIERLDRSYLPGCIIALEDESWQNLAFEVSVAIQVPNDAPPGGPPSGPGSEGSWETGPYSAPVPCGFNPKPLAVLSTDQYLGPAPLSVTLDASASSGGDAEISSYGWDLDGDGDVEITKPASQPEYVHVFQPGTHAPQVFVTNAAGETSRAGIVIQAGGWTQSLGTPDNEETSAVAADSAGNSYWVSTPQAGLPGPLVLLRCGSDGAVQWARRLGPRFGPDCRMVADASGVALLAETFSSSGGAESSVLVRLAGSGALEWAWAVDAPAPYSRLRPAGLAAGETGAYYLLNRDPNAEPVLLRLEANGSLPWAGALRDAASPAADIFMGSELALAAQARLIVFGRRSHYGQPAGLAIAALDTDGNLDWQATLGSPESRVPGLCTLPNGGVQLAYTDRVGYSTFMWLAELGVSGSLQHAYVLPKEAFSIPGGGSLIDDVNLAAGPDGSLLLSVLDSVHLLGPSSGKLRRYGFAGASLHVAEGGGASLFAGGRVEALSPPTLLGSSYLEDAYLELSAAGLVVEAVFPSVSPASVTVDAVEGLSTHGGTDMLLCKFGL